MTEIEKLLADHEAGHSVFQMDYFITSKAGGMTAYGQYKQALRELHKRYAGLKELGFAKMKLNAKIEKLAYELTLEKADPFAYKRDSIKLERRQWQLSELENTIADTQREYDHFAMQALALKEQVGELSPERRRELDAEMWVTNIKRMAALDFIISKAISRQTFEIMLSLPAELYGEFRDPEKLLEWFNKTEIKRLESERPEALRAPA